MAAFVSGLFLQPLPPTRPLSLPDLRQRVVVYNNQQLLLGIFLIPASLFAWVVSFITLLFFFRWFFWMLWLPTLLALVPTMLAMVALVLFGVWNTKSILNQDDDYIVELLPNSVFTESHGFGALGLRIMGTAIILALLVEVLLCAPKSTVMAIQAFRSVLKTDEKMLQQAYSIRQQLFENRDRQRWMPLDHFTASPHALILLHRLKLITVDDKDKMVRLAS